ncbi:response regulator transcription factor [Kitasatospora purpeofusca]|uniref:response regulator transcription factor n=1 Tax=Kitasatospora purpeofusca TaxID=67352 RepID=UPI003681CA8F
MAGRKNGSRWFVHRLRRRAFHLDPFLRSAGSSPAEEGPGVSVGRRRVGARLALMAEGRSNAEIATELFLSGAAVAKHVGNVFLKLGMPSGEDNRRVKAILTWFEYN